MKLAVYYHPKKKFYAGNHNAAEKHLA
jgi:hypothetical protein